MNDDPGSPTSVGGEASASLSLALENARLSRDLQAALAERQRVEEALHESQRRLEEFFDHASSIVWVKDLAGRFLKVNRYASELLHRPVEDFINRTVSDLYPRAEADAYADNDRLVVEAGVAMEFEESLVLDDGPHSYLSVKFPVRNASGAIYGIGAICTDITARKRAEAALRESEAARRAAEATEAERRRFLEVLETLPPMVCLLTPDHHVAFANRSFREKFGESHGRRCHDYCFGQSEPCEFCESYEVLKTGRPHRWEVHGPGGSVIEAYDFPFADVDGTQMILEMDIDVTARRQAEAELARHREHLEELVRQRTDLLERANAELQTEIAERKRAELAATEANARLMEADRRKDEFLAILSHELRNPLAPIRHALPVLASGRLDEPGKRAIAVVERQMAYLTHLVDDLLDVSRIATGRIELRRQPVTLASVVSAAVEAASPAFLSAHHSLTVAVPDEPIWLDADAARLAQVLTNLLDNSAKYTPPGGEVRLDARRERGEAVVAVRDNGLGLPADALPNVFEMFWQVSRPDKPQGGLGIGLALAKRLMGLHGGTIEAHSAGVGRGAEFVVRVPISEAGAGSQPEPRAAASGRRRALKVLVVDDNADFVDMLGLTLEAMGHEAWKALDGPGALSAAATHQPDIVLLDLGLPGMSGFEVARALRASPETAAVRLVALTGWGQEEDRRATRAAGFDCHLTKPTDPDTLARLFDDLARAT